MINDIRASVEADFARVNTLIIDQLYSDVDMVENVGQYIVDSGGKRLRPLLTLLAAASVGEVTEKHITFAAIIEFIHTATLLHDDVVDISTLRRGKPTVNSEFGNAPSVLVGDFLYTRAFQLMVQLDDMRILALMADVTNQIAEGEVLQLVRAGDPETSREQYFDVITRKTAILFAAACEGAVMLSGESDAVLAQMHSVGLNLGIAFQLIDDVLDYEGDPETTGKNVGDDLNEGKPTLPLIHAMSHASPEDAALIADSIRQKSVENLDAIVALATTTGGIQETRRAAVEHCGRVSTALADLPATAARASLEKLAEFSIARES
ncbi:polyprenyl synthetase family protein [Luminiphilus sp.]|nr:polyprenyl synthetase family protein [Luminiphilus sp.]MDB2315917.1 polyprenyl synthetase family protein [Luminiphilus sp.]MDB2377256.1 polyprenyl synthetase family protein [Luminiphilus sp.]MDB2441645.1 polyprenyl synthetase family protein [Luminiphilus sp.]MDB2622814.1 polyprenyl synthetase family protein [Luminiphilus sp.]